MKAQGFIHDNFRKNSGKGQKILSGCRKELYALNGKTDMIWKALAEDAVPIVKAFLDKVQKGRTREECLKIFITEFSPSCSRLSPEAIRWMRYSPLFAKAVFGLDINPLFDQNPMGQGAWDSTTPVSVLAMFKFINSSDTVLAIGPGPFATEACVLSIEKKMPVTALEIYPPYIAGGQATAKANNADVKFIHSDIFQPFSNRDKMPETADFITWNPPYVPSDEVRDKGLFPFPSDGGPTGRELMERALRELPERYRQAKLMFVVNAKRHSEETIISMIKQKGFDILDVFGVQGSPSKAFIMQYAASLPLQLV